MEREGAEFAAANERIAAMAEEPRKAELVRDRLAGLDELMGSYAEGHDMRARLEALHLKQALEGVQDDIQHPRAPEGARRGARVDKGSPGPCIRKGAS